MNSPNETKSETEPKTQAQKPKGTNLANISFILAILTFIYALLELTTMVGFVDTAIGIVLCLVGIVLGTVALVKVKEGKGTLGVRVTAILGIVICSASVFVLIDAFRSSDNRRERYSRIVCASNLRHLWLAVLVYNDENDKKYPVADKWCDLLLEYAQVTERQFVCKAALRRGDQHRCSYAMNPNCKPSSPNDVVLLFESKGGWNQSGGTEMLTTENHRGKGCNILFNDGRVEFVKPERLGELKWEIEVSK